jgi:hypothetical protein
MANFCEAKKKFLEMIESELLCLECKLAVASAKSELKDPAVQKSILTAADQACNLLRNDLRRSCQDIVSAYGVEAINYVSDNLDPANFCLVLGLCQ